MINIGLIGESPYDTKAIKHLLQKRYDVGYRYTTLLKNVTGDHLNTLKAIRAIASEVKQKNPDVVVVMRDADAYESDINRIKEKQDWYIHLSGQISNKSLFLLNIFELEALLFADIDTLNAHYGTSFSNRNVMYIDRPKEELKRKTKGSRKYAESHCPVLFKLMRIEIVSKNCTYFRDFLGEFTKLIGENKKTA